MKPLISTAELEARLGRADVRVVDARWYIDPAQQGSEAYRAGHIPAAVFLDLDRDLSAPGGRRGGPIGRHPWPAPARVAEVMSRIGVSAGVTVVAYDDMAGGIAARVWYLLRAFGHEDVAVLDGGLAKWVAEGRALTRELPDIAPGSFEAREQPGWVVAVGEAAAAELLLDARAPERYRGDAEPIDLRAGHIPRAVNAPFSDNLTAAEVPVFRSAEELRERYASLGADQTEPIVYCGSGVTACHDLLALELAGLRGRLYAGSWSEWSSDPARPIETGSSS